MGSVKRVFVWSFGKCWLRCYIWVWLVSATMIVIVVAGSFILLQTPTVNAEPESYPPLNCLSCHIRVLKGHDKLGSGNEACWACHDNTDMKMLHLIDGTQLSPASSSQLCGQCHQMYYEAWEEGTHGISSVLGKVQCAHCHEPHQPQITPSSISEHRPLPAPESDAPLDCLGCHIRVLKGHDKLGSGSEACWACHYNKQMGVLHLAGGETKLPLQDYPQLCAQCHQQRYNAWNEGTHGVPPLEVEEGEPASSGTEKAGCVNCHEPHQPQVALLNITRPHPSPMPSPPQPSTMLLLMLGVTFTLIIALIAVVVTKGELP